MSEAEQQIVRLLTELRDAQREDLAYRRKVLDESFSLQKRAIRLQRIGLLMVLVVIAVGVVVTLFAGTIAC